MSEEQIAVTRGRGFTNLSLFSGAGGMDLGLEAAGFEPIACIENNSDARLAIGMNRPDWCLPEDGDVVSSSLTLTPAMFGLEPGELDLVSGGPPCQPFSAAAQWAQHGRKGMADARAQTIHALLAFVARFRPRAVLLENVLGFVSGESSALPTINSGFRKINRKYGTRYEANWTLLNAADFGVPQNRRRVIVLAFRDGTVPNWPDATHAQQPLSVGEALAGLPAHPVPRPAGKWTGLLPNIPPGQNYQWLTEKGGGEHVFGYRTKFWNFLLKLDPSLPSWTLAASPGPSTGPFHWDNRPLSPLEMLRIQTFPDGWTLPGDVRTQTRLIGNATPALLAEVIGRSILSSISNSPVEERREYALSIPRGPIKIEVLTSTKVAAQYRHLVGDKAAHPGTGLGPAPRSAPQLNAVTTK